MDPTQAMRNFHSSFRTQMMEDIKDPEMIEKLWGMNYLSSVPFGQSLQIPSNFLLPKLQPKDVSVLDEEKENHDTSLSRNEDN